ncbi:hypothetical protein GOODEAATRI_005383, partial [Goodea atripinnis]
LYRKTATGVQFPTTLVCSRPCGTSAKATIGGSSGGMSRTSALARMPVPLTRDSWNTPVLSFSSDQQEQRWSSSPAVTLLPFPPLKEGNRVPARPPLPQCYESSERIPHAPPHHSQPGGRPLHGHRPDERKASSRNGAHSQAPDYRLYKSEPELTTVKEEGDEANGEDKDKTETSTESKDTPVPKVPPYPVGIVTPRTKSPMNPPESSTIASYVTLRKTKKPESRCVSVPFSINRDTECSKMK